MSDDWPEAAGDETRQPGPRLPARLTHLLFLPISTASLFGMSLILSLFPLGLDLSNFEPRTSRCDARVLECRAGGSELDLLPRTKFDIFRRGGRETGARRLADVGYYLFVCVGTERGAEEGGGIITE